MRSSLLLFCALFFLNSIYCQKPDVSKKFRSSLDSMVKNIDTGDFAQAEYWLSQSKERFHENPNEKDYFLLRYNEGLLHLKKWQLDTAHPILEECLLLARQSGDSSEMVMANGAMSQLKSEESQYGVSVVYGTEALKYVKSTDNLQYYAVLTNLSISYMLNRDTEKSLQYAAAAKDFYERQEMYLEMALILNNIGELYREQFKDFEVAEQHYKKAAFINKWNGFTAGLAANYLNLAIPFDNSDRIDSALHYIDLSLQLRTEMGDIGGLARVFNALGEINLHKGDMQGARKAFSETVRISKENGIDPGVYYGNLGLGKTYFKFGAYNLSRKYLEKALQTAVSLNAKPLIASGHESLYELEREDGNYKSALNHFEMYSMYSDSIRMQQSDNEIAKLKTQYETDLARTENMLLKANQTTQNAQLHKQRITTIGLWLVLALVLIITANLYFSYNRRNKSFKKEAALRYELQEQYHTVNLQKEELKELNELKNNIFSVLGHDLKAPLANMSSLISLMDSGDLDRDNFGELARHLDQETKAALVSLQNILIWSQAKAGYGKADIEELSVAPIVKSYLKNGRRQIDNKQLRISTNWDQSATVAADKNQFKSIAYNLISNAIKFTPQGGEIILTTTREKNGVVFSVYNEGEAIPKNLVEDIKNNQKIVSHRGTHGEKGTGIGLRIVNDFAELHGGYLEFITGEYGGTEVRVFFPFAHVSAKRQELTL